VSPHLARRARTQERIAMNGKAFTRFEPTRIAPETFLVHDHQGEGTAPVSVALNTMVIRAAEPVVVDTGVASNRERYLADVFGLVEPEDVRWVFLSHDDVDHTGNVDELMARCPNATLILNWFMVERMGASLGVCPTRQRWIGDGESFTAGDRVLHAVRPPVFDSPTTRGLFDPTTGVYWGSDSFAAPMPTPVTHADELEEAAWIDGMAMFDHYVSPWLALVDEARFRATVDRVAALRPTVLAGCHTPVITGARVGAALEAARLLPGRIVPPQPDQAVLEQIQALVRAAA
jgi:flavorubredoxin